MALRIVVLCHLLALASADSSYSKYSQNYSDPYKINRIIGGENAAKGEFPHQVSLQWGDPPFSPHSHLCGGSIISNRWILTAAHCVTDLPNYGYLVIKAGKNLIKVQESTEQTSLVLKIFVHERYGGAVSPFDIALLKLTRPLKFNAYVSPIDLPKVQTLPSGKVILSGWGSMSMTNRPILPNALQKVSLPIINLDVCRSAMSNRLGQSGQVHITNLCTGPLTGGLSPCNGDSGGPLIKENKNGRKEIVGIVSWGLIPCASVGAPSVFVRVSAFIDWIHNIMNNYKN